MQTFGGFFIAFIAVCLGAPLFRRFAVKQGILDIPSHRKVHTHPVPLFGGMAIFAGVLMAFLMYPESLRQLWVILAGAAVMLYMGALDDMKGLSAKLRIGIQLLVSALVILAGNRVSFLPATWWGNVAEFLVTMMWLVGVTNAFNYLDGLDGLASGSAVLNFFALFAILYGTNQFTLGLACAIFAGACLGFLPHNFRRDNKMFLGDAGSMFLGFTLAGMAIVGNWANDNSVRLFIPILVMGVPIFDMIFTTIMRVKEQKVTNIVEWLRYGGKDHFHHYLVDLGLSRRGAVVFIYCLTCSLGLSAYMVSNDSVFEGILTLLQASIIFGVIGLLIVMGKKRRVSGWELDERRGAEL